jgi:2-oxoglutarate dehydrogenase E2 component (dihydrolipoamide succinyltransferase)
MARAWTPVSPTPPRRTAVSSAEGVRLFRASRAAAAAATVEVPAMGDSITEGAIAAVLKQPGDAVAVDEVIAQIETDKVTIDVRAPVAGVVAEVLVAEGDTVVVGQGVCRVDESAAVSSDAAPKKKGAGGKKKAAPTDAVDRTPVTVEVPAMGDSITEGAVAALGKAPGDAVAADEVIAQIETDKVTIDVRAPGNGTLESYAVKEGDTVVVGQALATVVPGDAPEKEAPAAAASSTPAAPPAASAAKPEARAPPAAASAPPSAPPTAPPILGARAEKRVKMTRLRMRVAERLKSAQNTYAMLTTFNEIDMTNLMNLRAEYKDAFLEKHGAKLGFMSCFIKSAQRALQREPAVNAIIDGDEIVYREYYDISIAVSAPRGLVVPVLRDVDRMSFADVEAAIAAFGKKARDGTLAIDEMTGGTFTISNGGVFGSLNGTPIVNPPQSAILGMHSIQKRPVVIGDQIVPRPMMNVALTYDHRLVDGREAVTFLKTIKEGVEDPRRLLLDL